VAVVGGLAFSQLVTLYVTPVFYTYLDEWQQWFSRRRARKEQMAGVTPPPDMKLPGHHAPTPAGAD
jgi:HAE1 family hydrophobic/amphiphilic exporter-1